MSKILICQECGKEYRVKDHQSETSHFCSRECQYKYMSKQKRGEWIVKICPSCGKSFESLASKNKKYCSQKCNEERNEKYITYLCDCCGKAMRIKKNIYQEKIDGKRKGIYCSRECSNQSKHNGKEIICDNCGKSFYRIQSHIDRQDKRMQNSFCSLECQKEYLHKQKFELRKCEVCGENLEVSKSSTQRFCSDACQNIWQTTRTKELNPKFASVLTPCTYCGKQHYVKPYKFDIQENFFCSIECRRSWFAEIYSQTEENKTLQREKILRQLENGSFSHVDTKPQLLVNTILDNQHIEYKREATFEYWAIDNYLEFNCLAIEVQGDYWHANPIIFNQKLTQVQYNRINNDKRKHTYFKNKHNFEILYLWEYDIINNTKLCEMLIQEYINNDGILENYHSFNYHIEDGQIRLNDILIVPYQDMNVNNYKDLLIV
jgi:predicted nucleic acid-binding Zn ribbon protein